MFINVILQWIPALKDGRLNLGEFMLPVAADKLPQSYSMLAPDVQLPNMKWVDGHKPVFSCSIHTESSVHPQVQNFFFKLITIACYQLCNEQHFTRYYNKIEPRYFNFIYQNTNIDLEK